MKCRYLSVLFLMTTFFTNAQDNFLPCDEELVTVDENVLKTYEMYETQAQKEYDNYIRSVKSLWSGDSILTDTQNQWVEYSPDFQSRSVVDFKTGKVTVSVVMKPDENDSLLNKKMNDAMGRMLTSRGTTCSYFSLVDSSQTLSEVPLMEGLVDLSRLEIKDPNAQQTTGKKRHFGNNSKDAKSTIYLTSNSGMSDEQNREVAQTIVAKMLASGSQTRERSPLLFFPRDGGEPFSDGETCSIVSLQMNLVSSDLGSQAELYKKYVDKYGNQRNVEKALIYAVMEKESNFNPKATSRCPAYGLMQIVPKTAGLAAYRYVYDEDVIPTSSYLYVPKQNVELGVAYLRMLMDRFKSVTDEDCRRLCVIVAYNAGAGNVSRSFTGGTSLAKAIPFINSMSYAELMKHLSTRMSSAEARNYVVKVSELREKYLKNLK